MTVYRGLDHGIKGGHFAVHSFLSGVLNSEAQNRPDGNVTIDQYLADEVGFETRFPSLTIGSEGGIHGGCQIAWTKSGVRVPPITGPAELFEKLFVGDSEARQVRRLEENRLQGSILDAVREDANRLLKRVNREDKDKLAEYFNSIRDVEKRLELRRALGQSPEARRLPLKGLRTSIRSRTCRCSTNSWPWRCRQIRRASPRWRSAAAFYRSISGSTRRITGSLITATTRKRLPISSRSRHHQIKHFGKFLNRLSQMRDGERSLLDSTAVVFGSGMGNGASHKNSDLPIILAGGVDIVTANSKRSRPAVPTRCLSAISSWISPSAWESRSIPLARAPGAFS